MFHSQQPFGCGITDTRQSCQAAGGLYAITWHDWRICEISAVDAGLMDRFSSKRHATNDSADAAVALPLTGTPATQLHSAEMAPLPTGAADAPAPAAVTTSTELAPLRGGAAEAPAPAAVARQAQEAPAVLQPPAAATQALPVSRDAVHIRCAPKSLASLVKAVLRGCTHCARQPSRMYGVGDSL